MITADISDHLHGHFEDRSDAEIEAARVQVPEASREEWQRVISRAPFPSPRGRPSASPRPSFGASCSSTAMALSMPSACIGQARIGPGRGIRLRALHR